MKLAYTQVGGGGERERGKYLPLTAYCNAEKIITYCRSMPGFSKRCIVEHHQKALALMATNLLLTWAQFCSGQVCFIPLDPSLFVIVSLQSRQLTVRLRWRKYDILNTYACNSHMHEIIRRGVKSKNNIGNCFTDS